MVAFVLKTKDVQVIMAVLDAVVLAVLETLVSLLLILVLETVLISIVMVLLRALPALHDLSLILTVLALATILAVTEFVWMSQVIKTIVGPAITPVLQILALILPYTVSVVAAKFPVMAVQIYVLLALTLRVVVLALLHVLTQQQKYVHSLHMALQ